MCRAGNSCNTPLSYYIEFDGVDGVDEFAVRSTAGAVTSTKDGVFPVRLHSHRR